MKNFITIFIGSWCLLFSVNATALSALSFPFPISNFNFFTTLFVNNFSTQNTVDFNCEGKADDDKDGVCNEVDCAPMNPRIPGLPGTPCDDKNDFTKEDKIQPDGCTCIGTTTWIDTPITIDLGADRQLKTDEPIVITTSVLQYNTCIVTTCKEESPLIAHWNMNDCQLNTNNDQTRFVNNADDDDFCANIVTTGLYRTEGDLSCNSSSYNRTAKNAIMVEMPDLEDFKDNHPSALRFDIIVDPSADVSRINQLSFMKSAPATVSTSEGRITNNAPTKYGIRILKSGKQVYKAIGMMTSSKWNEARFDFTNEPFFEVSSNTVFTVELLAYAPEHTTDGTSIWSLDDIKIYGGCCNTTSFQSSRYLWSNGARTNSITVNEPGSYTVTVTDCNGTTAVDEVKISKGGEESDLSESN